MPTIQGPQGSSQYSLPCIVPGTSFVKAFTAASSQTAAVGSSCVRVCAVDQGCWIKFGVNPTADKTTSIYLPVGVPEYFGCLATDLIAVLRDSADGTLCITPAALSPT